MQRYKFIHCPFCAAEGEDNGLELFVTPSGDLGVTCWVEEHSEFRVVIQNKDLSQCIAEIGMSPCCREGCDCKEGETTH